MRLSLEHPSQLSAKEIAIINEIAAEGFGIDDPADMLEDTVRHIEAADVVHRAYNKAETVGFALYKERLWRACY